MRKALFILIALLLIATAKTASRAEEASQPAAEPVAQPAAEPAAQPAVEPVAETMVRETTFEADLRAGASIVNTDKNAGAAAKYDYLHSSASMFLNTEWDPLPHRFVLDSHYLNKKDYFGDMDYSWRDVIVLNVLARSLFRNLEHLNIGKDDPTTPLPSFTDRDPLGEYGAQTRITRAFLRLKTPDFPFHVYAEARQVDHDGLFQQRFLNRIDTTAKVSESRASETKSTEITVGANSHLGPVELDYAHTHKKTDESGDKVLSDPFPGTPFSFQHNLLPDLEASSDTVKLHTSFNGRIVAAATYTSGDRKNKDGGSSADYSMTAGDVTWIPLNALALFVKYRHYDLDTHNPALVTATTDLGPITYHVRDSISSRRDVVTGTARYRVTGNLSLKAEYDVEAFKRDVGVFGQPLTSPPTNTPAFWDLPKETTKNTVRLGAVYRILRTILVRADYRHLSVDNPAYNTDPDSGNYTKATVSWTPSRFVNMALGYNGTREKRDFKDLSLTGRTRDTYRDQAFGSVSVLIAKRTSVTAAYSYFRNKVEEGIVFRDLADVESLDRDAPYTDRAQSGSFSVTHSPMDGVTLTLEAKRTTGKGSFKTSGTVTGTDGIAGLSDTNFVEGEYGAEIAVDYTKQLGYELRYLYRDRKDKIDNTLDGTAQMLLATLSLKW